MGFEPTHAGATILCLNQLGDSHHIVIFMVGMEGFEPPTPWSQAKCATKLRYIPPN